MTAVRPETLPPTSNAAMFHSYRTYHQTQSQRGESINPLGWEFFIQKGSMMLLTLKEPPAPPNLLNIVSCSCKTGYKTMTCSCHKHVRNALILVKNVVQFLVMFTKMLIQTCLMNMISFYQYSFIFISVRINFHQTDSQGLEKNK